MRKLIIIILLLVSNPLQAQKNKYSSYSVGLVPYQFLSRSWGAFYEWSNGKGLNLEYRPTYTFPTYVFSHYWMQKLDLFYYKGINNMLIVSYEEDDLKVGAMTGYRYWWYDKHKVPMDGAYNSDYHFYETQSSQMHGLAWGINVEKQYFYGNFMFSWFMSFGGTYFREKGIRYDDTLSDWQLEEKPDYPITFTDKCSRFNVAFGVKIGFHSPRED